jgi:hypothetical protein
VEEFTASITPSCGKFFFFLTFFEICFCGIQLVILLKISENEQILTPADVGLRLFGKHSFRSS